MAEKEFTLSDKGRQAMAYLQSNEGEYLGAEIADSTGLNPKGIHGVLKPLVSNGLVSKARRDVPVTVTDKEGNEKETTKEYTVYSITDAGQALDL